MVMALMLVLWSVTAAGQSLMADPSHTMHPPVVHPMHLSGTFGELRSNHFHQGIDIKSRQGVSGDDVFSIMDGFVSRIKISASGYGNAVYIQHPNGLTSVYAHLGSFMISVAELVLQKQYEQENFEVDFKLTENFIKVRAGQYIGKMGSTGHSLGPHLHFEIRETATERLLNPLQYGFDFEDSVPPILKELKIYHLDHRHIAYRNQTLDGTKSINDTMEIDAWRIGIGVETFDPHNRGLNRNGLYQLELYCDDRLVWGFDMDNLTYEDCSYYLGHIDYEAKLKDGKIYHNCFRKPGNRAKFYLAGENDGVIPLFRDRLQKMKLIVSDFHGNQTIWSGYLRRSKVVSSPNYPTFQSVLPYDQDNSLKHHGFSVEVPKGALFETTFLSVEMKKNGLDGVAPIYQLSCLEAGLRKPIKISFHSPNLSDALKSKLVIAEVSDSIKPILIGGSFHGDTISANYDRFGQFTLVIDTIPPQIELTRNHVKGVDRLLRFKITDAQKYANGLQKLKYTIHINDHWQLATYDLKSNQINCELSRARYGNGEHLLQLIVSDYVGNQSTYDYRFNFN